MIPLIFKPHGTSPSKKEEVTTIVLFLVVVDCLFTLTVVDRLSASHVILTPVMALITSTRKLSRGQN